MHFAYADPPYPGLAHYYPEHREVDHEELICRLRIRYPDSWALSTSSAGLRDVWQLCPEARLCVWVKARQGGRCVRAISSFEALLVAGGRLSVTTEVLDALVYRGRHRAFPSAMIGMKPPAFAEWMFRLLGAQQGDQLDDLFPGSGAVSEAWRRYTGQSAAAMKAVSAS